MSYYHLSPWFNSLDHFTVGQGKRMQYAIRYESVLQNITSSSCAKISKLDYLCPQESKTVSLSNIGNAMISWSISDNIEIISNNNTSITIKPKNNDTQGKGWVKAWLNNGIKFTESFWIGKPLLYFPHPINVCSYRFEMTDFIMPKSPGAENYFFSSSDPNNFSVFGEPGGKLTVSASHPGFYQVTLTVSTPCGETKHTFTATVLDCSDGGPGGFETFEIYPNPATDNLNISSLTVKSKNKALKRNYNLHDNKKQVTFKIYNFQGNLLKQGTFFNKTKVNISIIKKGGYLLKITTADHKVETHQIIVE